MRWGWTRGDRTGRRAARRRDDVKSRRVLAGRGFSRGDRIRGTERATHRFSSKVARGLRGGCFVAAAAVVAALFVLGDSGGFFARFPEGFTSHRLISLRTAPGQGGPSSSQQLGALPAVPAANGEAPRPQEERALHAPVEAPSLPKEEPGPQEGPSRLEEQAPNPPGGPNPQEEAPSPEAPNTPQDGGSAYVPPPPALQAAAAVLLDRDTGQLLYTKSAHERRPPGGLTKIVTALVALERASLEEPVRIGRHAVQAPGYKLRLEEGDELPLRDLVLAMLFHPGNDGAIAIAEHVAGSVSAFAKQMESTARRAGAEHSAFRNPHGLDEEGHRSSAYDLALIAREALRNPDFAALVEARRAPFPWQERARELRNFNSFLWRYPGAVGVQSAYTPASGHSIVAAARRESRSLIAVVLGAPSAEARWLDVASLLDWGFANYQSLSQLPWVDKMPYEVQAGDTLTSLSRRFAVPISAIRSLNGIEDPDRLAVGSLLWIPR